MMLHSCIRHVWVPFLLWRGLEGTALLQPTQAGPQISGVPALGPDQEGPEVKKPLAILSKVTIFSFTIEIIPLPASHVSLSDSF